MKLNFKGVSRDTWVRIISMFLVFVNLVATNLFDFKLLPFEDEEIHEMVSIVLVTSVSIWTAWKNNSFTSKAQEADKVLRK